MEYHGQELNKKQLLHSSLLKMFTEVTEAYNIGFRYLILLQKYCNN